MRARAAVAAWAAVAVVLAGALSWRAVDAHALNAELHRRLSEAEAEFARQEAQRERARAELKALDRDPTYVESKLRELRETEPGERLVEPAPRPRGGR